MARRPQRARVEAALSVGVIVLGAVAGVWLTVAVSVAGAARNNHPDVALRAWKFDGIATASKASQLLLSQGASADTARIQSLAVKAVNLEPMSVEALRTLALLSDGGGNRAAARRQFELSRQLSRRDLLTSIWFIEEAVSRNDVRGALRHYEIALRTSRSAQGLLFPVLDSALADPDLVKPIADLIAAGDQWGPSFVEYVAKSGKQPAYLTRALLARPETLSSLPNDLQGLLLAKLVDKSEFDVAEKLYRQLSGESAPPPTIRNGDFDNDNRWPPFDWSLASAADYGAGMAEGEGQLSIYSREGAAGTVARQLLSLAPGLYSLGSMASLRSDTGEGTVLWSVTCATQSNARLMTLRMSSGASKPVSSPFSVAPGCARQWLNLEVVSSGDDHQLDGEIEWVKITRRKLQP